VEKKPKRKQPNMHEKLAACLLQLLEFRDGQFRPIIDRAWAKDKTPKEIIARFEVDHYPLSVMAGGTNHPTNLQWLTVEDHAAKTHGPDRVFHNKLRRKQKRDKNADCEDRKTPRQIQQEWAREVKQGLEKQELTEANKEYKKAVYAKRKAARKKWLAGIKGKKK
jgi:hypothetical protein